MSDADQHHRQEWPRAVKERYALLFNAVAAGLAYYKAIYDDQGKLIDLLVMEINPAGAAMSGVAAEAQIGKTWRQVWPEVDESLFEKYQLADETGEVVRFEDDNKLTGRIYDVVISRTAPGELVATFHDITELKQVEADLKKYQLFSENSRDLVLFVRRDGRIIEANEAAAAAYGYSREELLELSIFDIRSVETLEKTEPQMEEADLEGILFETVHKRKDGSTFPVEVSSRGADINGERVLLSVIRDITKRKQTEEDLHRTFGLITSIAEGTEDMIAAEDSEFRYIFFNDAYRRETKKIWGSDIEVGTSMLLAMSRWPEEQRKAMELWERALRGESFSVTEKFGPSEEQMQVYDLRYDPIYDENGHQIGAVQILRNITEQHKMQQALHEAREEAERRAAELSSYFQSMAEGAVLIDDSERLLYMNEAGREILGIPLDNFAPGSVTEFEMRTLEGEPMERHQAASSRALKGEIVKDLRHIVITPDGEEVMVSVSASPVRDPDGRIVGATLVFRDIRQAVEFERQQEELLRRERHITEVLKKTLVPEVEYQIPFCDIAVRYEAAYAEAQVGGDFYDVFDLGDNKIGILIGDVAGKGLEAAIQVASVRHTVRSYAYIDPRPSRVMTLANEALCKDPEIEIGMVTALFAVLDTNIGILTFTSAGHEPPLLRRFFGAVEELPTKGMVLGIMSGCEYQEHSAILYDHDLVVMFTDGITEARADRTDMFGVAGVKSFLSSIRSRNAADLADGVLNASKEHAGGNLRDDAAVVVFGIKKGREAE